MVGITGVNNTNDTRVKNIWACGQNDLNDLLLRVVGAYFHPVIPCYTKKQVTYNTDAYIYIIHVDIYLHEQMHVIQFVIS